VTTVNYNSTKPLRNQRGFTLIELLIAMTVGAVLMAAVMTAFMAQHETYLVQDDVVEMQQNARVAMTALTRDIRSIGFDPGRMGFTPLTTPNVTADGVAPTLVFSRDDGTNALKSQTVTYALFDAFVSVGGNDGLVDDLGRRVDGGSIQPVAENISQIEFRYLDENGNPINGSGELGHVRSIQVSIMATSANPATKAVPPSQTYSTPGGQEWTPGNGFRSLFLTSTIHCRNLGL